MEFRHLRYFVAIAEEGGFTQAAERLWVADALMAPSLFAPDNRCQCLTVSPDCQVW